MLSESESESESVEGQTVLWFLIIFYYLDCTKCKFPDFSQYSFFPWPSTKFPDFPLTFTKSGISLTFPWPLDTLARPSAGTVMTMFRSYVWTGLGGLTHWGRDKMDAISQMTFSSAFSWMKMFEFWLKFPLKFVLKSPIDNIPALVQIMAWRRPGDKPLSEPMMVSLLTHICVIQLQWVKQWARIQYQDAILPAEEIPLWK